MQATIHNEFLTLTVDTHGAEAVSLKNAAGQEMLWQADPAVWKRHAPILFPWTGKLPGGTFEVNGKTYTCTKLPEYMQNILNQGGLIASLNREEE